MDFIAIGKEAHANGELRAPAINVHVMEAIAGLPVGHPKVRQIMADFAKGFDAAVDAETDAIMKDLTAD